jgi:hypothetical protein
MGLPSFSTAALAPASKSKYRGVIAVDIIGNLVADKVAA